MPKNALFFEKIVKVTKFWGFQHVTPDPRWLPNVGALLPQTHNVTNFYPTAKNLSKFEQFGSNKISIPISKNFVYFIDPSLCDCAPPLQLVWGRHWSNFA